MTTKIKEILSWYGSDNPGTLTNLSRLLNHGKLAGTGKLVILPVDQGFEHGPARSFAANPPAYDPRYHFELAIEAGCNAYAAKAKRCGLVVVIWSYARGSGVSTAGETSIDVIAYAAQIAAQLGAHIIKVKLPTDRIEQQAAKEVYQKMQIPIATPTERVRHVVQSTFNGRRIVIFSGGATHSDEALLQEVQAIHSGGGFGSIIGRNSFQRSKPDALKLLDSVMKIYREV
jgi:DhnA family fructose-bisphosphate aldolase class Ia